MKLNLALIILLAIVSVPCLSQKAEEVVDKCADVKCDLGEVCMEGECLCMNECHPDWNNYPRSLCIENVTYRHECDFWRNACYCKKNDKRCGGEEFNGHKASLVNIPRYFSDCMDFGISCNWKNEKESFPDRMSRWFLDLLSNKWASVDSNEYDDSLLRPISKKARDESAKLFSRTSGDNKVNGGILSFWFCEIDRDNSGDISQSEISRLTQLLMPATPCLDTFLEGCRGGGQSIKEDNWHECFKVQPTERIACNNFK